MGGRPRTIISAKGREYRKAAVAAVHRDYSGPTLLGRMHISLDLYPPTARRFDVDNHLKAPLDAVTQAGLWDDDSQVDRLEVLRCPLDRANPRVVLTLTEAEVRR